MAPYACPTWGNKGELNEVKMGIEFSMNLAVDTQTASIQHHQVKVSGAGGMKPSPRRHCKECVLIEHSKSKLFILPFTTAANFTFKKCM